jgi:plasmid stability protein
MVGCAIVDSMKRRKESQLVVRKLDPRIVEALRTRAARHGHSMEAEHRNILRAALRPATGRTSFKEWLLKMPDVGTDRDFAPNRQRPRPVML